MAAVDAKRTNQVGMGKNILVTWILGVGDTGNSVYIGDLSEVSVQNAGGTGTCNLNGSNDGVNFGNIGATPLAVTPNVLKVDPSPAYVSVSAVATASVVVTVSGKRYS